MFSPSRFSAVRNSMLKVMQASNVGMHKSPNKSGKLLSYHAALPPVRTFTTLSSDITLHDTYLETYWRGKLLRFDYDILRKNDTCIETFHTAGGHTIPAASAEAAMMESIPRTQMDAMPVLAMRRNDTIDIDWDDDTCSTLNLTRLIEQQMERDEKAWNSLLAPTHVDPVLDSVLRELSESGYSLATFEDEQSDICQILRKVTFFSEPSNYVETFQSVKEAMPHDHNGLAVIHANHEMTVELINAKKYAAAFREKHPKFFDTLCTSPCIRTEEWHPNTSACQKVINIDSESLQAKSVQIEEQIDEIRLGELNPDACNDYVKRAYTQFEKMTNDSELLARDEIVETVTIPANATLLVDCTQAWYRSEECVEADVKNDLQVENCLLTNDAWKSTARGL